MDEGNRGSDAPAWTGDDEAPSAGSAATTGADPTPPTPPGSAGPDERAARGKPRRKSGILAHLPPVPDPVKVDVDGLSPKRAFYGWLAVVLGILAIGVLLNWSLTGGDWVPYEPRVQDPDAALGDTQVHFLSTHPYDLLTTSLFVLSIVMLGLSLFTRARTGGRMRPYGVPAAVAGLAALLALVLQWAGPHAASVLPGLADATSANASLLLVVAALAFVLAVGLLVVGAHRVGKRHELRLAGWLVFAGHWALTGMYYFVIENGDWVNMIFAYTAVFLLGYFAYQELVSRSLGKDNPSLRFTAAAVVIAAGVWYAFLRIEPLSQFLIETVAVHTTWMLEFFGQSVTIGNDGQTGFRSAISYPDALYPRTVIIILACTAMQSMMIFVAAALALKGPGLGATKVFQGFKGREAAKLPLFVVPSILATGVVYMALGSTSMPLLWQVATTVFVALPFVALWGVWVAGRPLSLAARRVLVIAVTVPIVYVLNLARNTGIIIMWADRWLEVQTPWLISAYTSVSAIDASGAAFGIAHNWVGKGGSLIALVAIAFIVFKITPEVLRALVGLLDLPRRRGPLEQYWRTLRGQRDETAPLKNPETA